MTKIFISHSSKDSAFAVELARLLTKLGCDVWVDLFKAPEVRKPSAAMWMVLEACEVILVVVSPDSMPSFRVQDVWQHSLSIGKRVIPVVWRPAKMPDPLQALPSVNFHEGDFGTALARLRAELGQLERGVPSGKLHAIQPEWTSYPESQPQGGTNITMARFTQRARRVLSLAQEECERFKHKAIGSEHLLLALVREESGVASHVLRGLGVDQERVDEFVSRLPASAKPTHLQPELTPGAKRVLELALDEGRRMGHRFLGTEHLLLGLLRVTEGASASILKSMNINPEEIRQELYRLLQESSPFKPLDDTPKLPNEGDSQ